MSFRVVAAAALTGALVVSFLACGPEAPPLYVPPDGGGGSEATRDSGAADSGPVGGADAGGEAADAGGHSSDAGGSGPPSDGGSTVVDAGTHFIDVHGRLRTLDGVPPAAPMVVVLNRAEQVATDEAGSFSFRRVAAPYELLVVDPASRRAVLHPAVTTTAPQLLVDAANAGAPRAATIRGLVGGPSLAAGERAFVTFIAPQTRGHAFAGSTGQYSAAVTWSGEPRRSGVLHAVRYSLGPGNLPSAYGGHAQLPLVVSAGEAHTVHLQLEPVSSAVLAGEVSVPAGYFVSGKELHLVLSGTPALYFDDRSGGSALSFLAPALEGGSLMVVGSAARPDGAVAYDYRPGLAPGASGVDLRPYAAPELLLPASGATAVGPGQRFSWAAAVEEALHVVTFVCAGGPELRVVGAVTPFEFPDLSAYGLSPATGAACRWWVEAITPMRTADEALGEDYRRLWNATLGTRFRWSKSPERPFSAR